MNRTRALTAAALTTAALAAGTLSACGGVDRDGTRDNIVSDIEEQLGVEVDSSCVDDVLDDYSDDDLEAIDEAINDDEMTELASDFALEIFDCVPSS